MKQPDFWKHSSFLKFLFLPFSVIYYLISTVRYLLTKPYKTTVPVICIGNVTVGGSGKTPTALAIANIILGFGHKVVFLSKGYGGSISYPLDVNDTNTAKEVGDEPLLLSKLATTIISRKREAGLKLACEKKPDVIIMDDGLQNPTIHKDLTLLVIDGTYGIGNGCIIPAGPLRESLDSAVKKSKAVIFIGEDLTNLLPKLSDTNTKVIRATISPANTHPDTNIDYIAFAGLGNPDKFFITLKNEGYNIVEKIKFSDHYNYSNNDIEKLVKKSKKKKAELITTEKDFVRLTVEQRKHIHVLPIEIKWDNENAIKEILKSILEK